MRSAKDCIFDTVRRMDDVIGTLPHYSHAIWVSGASVRIHNWLRLFCLSTDPHTADAERGQGFSAHQCAHNSQIIYDGWFGSASVFKTQGKK